MSDRKGPSPKDSIIIRPSDALMIQYRGEMLKLVSAMAKEIHHEVMGVYRPWRKMQRAKMAGDASVVELLESVFKRLRSKWAQEPGARRQAKAFVEKVDGHVKATFVRGIQDLYGKDEADDAKAKPVTPKRLKGADYDTALDAAVAENVALIKSIPSEYLEGVQREVMQAVQDGWPLDRLSDGLQQRYGITKRRADMIARDQCAKVTETMKQKRALAAGFTEATWFHSSGSRHPRKSHQAANGKRYNLAQGCWIDDEYIMPGQKVNCRCFCTFHAPGRD